ncbi:MAG: hypothetical protein ACKVHU_10815 [Acidimicrobiales bacterium]
MRTGAERHVLRQRTMPGVLDAGFALSKDETRTVLVVTSVLALPLTLLSVFLQRQYFGDDALGGVVNAFTQEPIRVDGRRVSDNTIVFVQIAVILASSLRVTLVAAALGPMMLARHRGISMTPGQLLSGVARRLPVVLVGWTMVKLIEGVGILGFVIGGLFAMVFCSMTVPAMVIGELGPFAAIKQSFATVGRGFGRVIGTLSLLLIVEGLVQLALTSLPSILASWLGFTGGIWVVVGCIVMADLILVPFVAASTTALYLDLLVRQAGLDLDLRFERLGVEQ